MEAETYRLLHADAEERETKALTELLAKLEERVEQARAVLQAKEKHE